MNPPIAKILDMPTENSPIKTWEKDDQPREKLLHRSSSALSNTELLAILIGSGLPDCNAVEIARKVMRLAKNDLHDLGKLNIRELMKVKGIGLAKAINITAAMELGKRRQAGMIIDLPAKTCSRDIVEYLQTTLGDKHHEELAVLYLNQGMKVKHFEIISKGGITSTIADPRLIIKKALDEHAVSIILCHNHPSGDHTPSKADKRMTSKIKEACKLMDISLRDHIIVSSTGYFSFADNELLQ